MIGYVTLGTNKYDEAADFYDALLGDIGASRVMEADTFIAWGVSPKSPAISIIKPQDGNAATVGNGVMVAIAMDHFCSDVIRGQASKMVYSVARWRQLSVR